jgi:hypothetical protein
LIAPKYSDATTDAPALEKLQPTNVSANLQAQIAAAQGDKAAAKNYWNLAISRLDPKSPASSFNKQVYEQQIARLGA